jgi:hypothetical protein
MEAAFDEVRGYLDDEDKCAKAEAEAGTPRRSGPGKEKIW